MKMRLQIPLILIVTGLFAVACGADSAAPADDPAAAVEELDSDSGAEVSEPETASEMDPIRIGVQTNSVAPIVILENGNYSGFEIDLATEIVARLYGGAASIEWVPISSAERFTSLADDQIDMLVRNILHSVGREEAALFSGGYLLSGNGFLVVQDSGFASFAELDGEKVAVPGYLSESLAATAAALGYAYPPFTVEDDNAAQAAFLSGQAKAMYHDWVLLAGLMDSSTQSILLDDSQLAPFGIALPLGEEFFRDEVDVVLSEMIADGSWQSIFENWFDIAVPWNVDDMFAYPPAN